MPSLKASVSRRFNAATPFISLDDVCYLISTITTNKDELGQPIFDEVLFMVYCTRLDVTRAEFAAAGQLGHKPNMMLLIDADAYDNQQQLEYNGEKFSIYKSFMRHDGYYELYCEVKADG